MDRKNLIITPGEECSVYENARIQCTSKVLEGNCVFKNCLVQGEHTIFKGCRFENCSIIHAAGLEDCSFENCEDVTVCDGNITNCNFENVDFFFLNESLVSDCTFDQIHPDLEVGISMEDVKIIRCTFSNIRVRFGTYLIDAVGESEVEECTFIDCATDREDLELIHCEEIKGKLFKRKKCYDITHNCTGLDAVKKLPSPLGEKLHSSVM